MFPTLLVRHEEASAPCNVIQLEECTYAGNQTEDKRFNLWVNLLLFFFPKLHFAPFEYRSTRR